MTDQISETMLSAPREVQHMVLLKSRGPLDPGLWRPLDEQVAVLALAPDTLLLVSRQLDAATMIDEISALLGSRLYNAVDYSAAMVLIKVCGALSRRLLASGTAVDLAAGSFASGACCRTRLAGVAAVIVAAGDSSFDVYCDRSQSGYLLQWLAQALETERLSAAH